MTNRFEQLDSIRGLAAVSVFFSHIVSLLALPTVTLLFSQSPLKLFVYGHAAVLLFFVLSGFVLSLPYLLGSQLSYKNFMVRRVCRVYIPYLVVIAVAMLAFHSLKPIYGLSDWISILSTGEFSSKVIFEHIGLIGNYNTDRFNGVIWTLVHEMRVYLIFPLLALVIIRFNWMGALAVCAALSLIGSVNNALHWEPVNGFQNSFSLTLHYCSLFIIGGLIAKHRTSLIGLYRRLPRLLKYGALLTALVLYTYAVKATGLAGRMHLAFLGEQLQDYVIVSAIVIFLTIALGSRKMIAFLTNKAVKFFGDISFSLYLWHLVLLIGLVHLLNGVLPMAVILLILSAASVVVAWLSYRYIELPAIRLGKLLTTKRQTTKRLTASHESSHATHPGVEAVK